MIVGSIPLMLPGLHSSLRIGLSGGSLLAALVLSRLGSVGSVVWYMPAAANQLFRDFGLAIFLACVGFEAGDHFIERAVQNSALLLLIWGAYRRHCACLCRRLFRPCRATNELYRLVRMGRWRHGELHGVVVHRRNDCFQRACDCLHGGPGLLAELMPIICAQILAIGVIRH